MEECTACKAQQSGSNGNFGGKLPDAFTYDDGKGVKDSVILTGPLSEVYTKALNIALRKTPLTKKEEESPDIDDLPVPKQEDSKLFVSNEALKEENETALLISYMQDNMEKEELKDLDENILFTTLSSDPPNIVANIAVVDSKEASNPEFVDTLQSYKDVHPNQDTILVVTVPTNSGSEGTKVYQKLINLNPHADVLGNDAATLEKAFESIYVRNNIKVFYGLEGFVQAIKFVNRDK